MWVFLTFVAAIAPGLWEFLWGGGGADGKQVFFLEAYVFCGSCFAICPHRHRRRIPFMLVGGVSKKHEVVHMYDRFMCFCKLGCGLVCS
jgi:hypothetical protein